MNAPPPAGAAEGPAPAWQSLPLRLSAGVLAELVDGGQSFLWSPLGPGHWRGGWGRHRVELRLAAEGVLNWRPLTPWTQAVDLAHYLALDPAHEAACDALPWRSDPILAAAMAAFPGLRILRQPLEEALLGFICSSSKQIVQIKAMLALLAQRFGEPLGAGQHALPTWERLATVPLAELQDCRLGYRARYLAETAAVLRADPAWAADLAPAPYAEAHTRLCALPGVGPKVADCVLLFGAGRLEAFPVDTWILKILGERYGLAGWKPGALAQFGRVHFGAAAGLAQQFLFAQARRSARSRAP